MTEHGHGDGRSTVMDAAEWDERYQSGRMWSVEPNRFFVEAVEGIDPSPEESSGGGRTAVDLACGEGRNAMWLARQGWQVTAVDFSEVAVDRGREVARAEGIDVNWVVADLQTWDFEGRRWDLVAHVYLHWEVLEREPFLDRCAAAVAPGGYLVLVGHDRSNIEHGHGGPQNPAFLTTPEELRERFEAAGLTVDRAETVLRSITVEHDDGTTAEVNAIDHVVVAHRG